MGCTTLCNVSIQHHIVYLNLKVESSGLYPSMFKGHSWQCLGGSYVILGIRPGSVSCITSILSLYNFSGPCRAKVNDDHTTRLVINLADVFFIYDCSEWRKFERSEANNILSSRTLNKACILLELVCAYLDTQPLSLYKYWTFNIWFVLFAMWAVKFTEELYFWP